MTGRREALASAAPAALLVGLTAAPCVVLLIGPLVFATPYWLACMGCALISITARFICGTWLHPGPLFSATWTAYFAVPAFVVTSLKPAPVANIFIVLVVAAVSLAGSLVSVTSSVAPRPRTVEAAPAIRWIVVAGGLTGLFAAMIATANAGLGYTAIFGLTGLRRAGLAIAVSRYSEGVSLSASQVALLTVTYAGAALAPFAAAGITRRLPRLFTMVWPVVGASAFSVATTARQAMIIAAALTLASALMVQSLRGGGRAKVRFGAVVRLVVGAALLAALFIFAAFSRVASVTGDTQAVIFRKLASYVGGSIPAFNVWLSQGQLTDGLPWTSRLGFQTFAGVAGLFGANSSGGYQEFASIDSGVTATNVFTVFRQMVTDFGLTGTVVVVTAGSVVAATTWRRAMTAGSTWPVMVTVAFIASGFYSGTGSLFASTNVCAALIAAALAMARWCRFPLTAEDAGINTPSTPSLTAPEAVPADTERAARPSNDEARSRSA